MASCRNWHTSRTQNAVPERACGFESHRGHILEESSEIGIGPVYCPDNKKVYYVSTLDIKNTNNKTIFTIRVEAGLRGKISELFERILF
jgi:hypothetical protein